MMSLDQDGRPRRSGRTEHGPVMYEKGDGPIICYDFIDGARRRFSDGPFRTLVRTTVDESPPPVLLREALVVVEEP